MLATTIALAACAGAVRPTPKAAPPARWDAMSTEQKHVYMTETVMPEVKALFGAWDPHRYRKMTCATCHGHAGFAMPNGDLLLEPEAVTTSASTDMGAFMHERVAPTMARLLGRPTYDCFGCHVADE